MSEYTEHYNLKKPSQSESYNVDDANTNNTIIDRVLYEKVDKKSGKDLSTNDFTDGYKKKIDSMQTLYRFKGTVITIDDLSLIENQNTGDVYKCKEDLNDYIWNGQEWVNIGQDADFNSVMEKIDNINEEMQQKATVSDLGKDYTGTNIVVPTVEGYGRIKKLYGKTVEEGTGDKSPDNPYTLKCVGDDVNLFDMTQLENIDINASKYIYLEAEPNTEYTLSTTLPSGIGNVADIFLISGHSTSSTTKDNGAYNGKTITITSDSNGYLTIAYRRLSGSQWTNLSEYKFKLQKGSKATAYSPYGYGTVKNVSENGSNNSSNIAYAKPLCSVGDVRDEIDYTNRKIIRKTINKVLNGTENIWCGGVDDWVNKNNLFWVKIPNAKDNLSNKCSHYTATQVNTVVNNASKNYVFAIYEYMGFNAVFLDRDCSTAEEFKAKLASSNVQLVCESATPTIEEIDCSNKIVQYADSTTVYNTDGAEIEVSLNNSEAISDINEQDKLLEEDINEAKIKLNEIDENLEIRATKEIRSNYGLGGSCKTISGNLNTVCGNKTGFYMGVGLTNSPTNNSQEWFFIIHVVHNSSYQHQIAMSFNSSLLYNRFMKDGVWSNWSSR